jgi:N-acetylglutamate synthase-like GNAT family acetyltransferase
MVEGTSIRKYHPSDLESCRSLWEELTEWHRRIYEDPAIGGSDPGRFFEEHLSRVGADNLWVAVQDGAVVGLTGLMGEGEEAEVEPLVVSEQDRRKGIGGSLLEYIVAEARRRGVKYLSVRPVARNVDAIGFFFNRGFVNVGHVELFKDLSEGKWKEGLRLFDIDFRY